MRVVRPVRSSFVVVALLAGGAATANAKTDNKETTKRTWTVDASHGTYSDAIPIDVPAFHSITPELALIYDSANGNGELGVGWSLDGVGVVERASPGKGAPHYDETDIFLLDGQELVPCAPGSVSPSCTTGGTHSTKIESYQRVALSGSGADSRWTITGKDGTRSVHSAVFSPGDGALVYRWGLHEVIDTVGNVVTYNWGTDQLGCCWEHLDSVTYAGVTVTFHYEKRPDHELAAVGSGAMRTVQGRLKTIDVTVGGDRLRAYKLGYTTSGATSRSLLSSVQQFGKDAELDDSGAVTGGTSLPAITIDYQANAPAFAERSNDLSVTNGANTQNLAIDINGDGKTDMLELYPNLVEMRRRTWISNGTGFDETSDEAGMSVSTDTRFLPMDVDGDGKTDLVELYPGLAMWGMRTWISNGTGFDQASDDAAVTLFSEDSHFIAMDIDSDGRSDLLELRPSFTTYRRISWLSTGTGFTQGADEPGIAYAKDSRFFAADVSGDGKTDLVELFFGFGGWSRRIWLSHGDGFSSGATDSVQMSDDDEFIPMDINGDGKTDLLQVHPFASVAYRRAWLSTGDSFILASDEPGAPFSANNWQVAIDVNGDGRSDLVEVDEYGFGLYRRTIWLSDGTRFVADTKDTDMMFHTSTKLMAADVDGDGLSEMIELYPAGIVQGRRVWLLSGGAYPDLLASVENGLGATTSISYTPSSAWDNTNNPPLSQTATAVTVTDGRGGSATTRYEYAGGLQDRRERRFLGFRHHVETLPCIDGETSCPRVETWFRQDYGAASKPERVDHQDGSGRLLRSELYEYTTNGATVPWTSLPTGEWKYSYAGAGADCPGAECKRTYNNRTFNEYGELAVEVDYGDYDASGDERTLTTTFVPNTEAYIVGKPAEAKTFAGVGTGGTLLNQTLSYYDGAKGWDHPPSAGLATTTARWLSSPSSFVETHKEYDAWGNLTAEIDALGGRTSYTLDPTYHLFQISTTNALGQTTSTAWDLVCGAPMQTTDLNSQATAFTYDPLCRMTERLEPGGKFERHAWMNLGDPGEQYELVETPTADGSAAPLWTRTYFDGYGRTWRTAAKGPDAATGDIHVDTTYNARGQQASVTNAYYATSGEAQPVIHATTSSYDALDRLTRVTHPDGNSARKTYGLWSVTDTDELGRAMTDHFDADDRRIAHDELVGGELRTATYAYDLRGNLVRSTDPPGNVTTYEHDSLGRQTRHDDPDRGTTIYEYDGADRLTAQTDAKGQRTELGYDALGRKTSKTNLAGTDAAATVSWTYDEIRDGRFNVGKLTTMTDEAGSETFDHDVAGNVVKTVRSIDGESYTFEHGFDAGGRKLWTTYPDGDTLGTPGEPLVYDGAGRLAAIPGHIDAARYDADGRPTWLDNANGTTTVREYSPERGWLTAVSTMSGDTTIQELAYARDAKGRITEVESPFAGEGWTYEYDELDRLVTATDPANPDHDQTLKYDAIGNITYNSHFGEYAYGTSRPHAVTAAGANTYAYDEAGLMTSGAGRTMTWDGDNRLASVRGGAPPSAGPAGGGDAAGCRVASRPGRPAWWWSLLLAPPVFLLRRRRTAKRPALAAFVVLALAFACTDDPAATGADAAADDMIMTFTYDADGARIQQVEGEVVRRHLGDGYEIEVGGSTIKYISLAGSLVARKQDDTMTWIHTDHLGSIQAATDEAGDEVHRKTYRPYGEVLSTEGTLAFEPRGYTGQRHDVSGLVYLHARYYDPALARFISPDSVIDGDDTIGLNRYAYVGNDPVNHDDVGGTCTDCPGIGRALGAIKRFIGTAAVAVGTSALAANPLVNATATALPDAGNGKVISAQMQLFGDAAAGPPKPADLIPRTIGGVANIAQDLGGVAVERQATTQRLTPTPRPVSSSAGPGGAIRSLRLPKSAGLMRLGKLGGPASFVLTAALDGWGYHSRYSETRTNGGSIPAAMFRAGMPLALKYSFGPISAGISDGSDVLQTGIELFRNTPDISGACGRVGRCN